ncbi:hypothetical protein CRUP_024786 [Coryphaenoides rupestris]|nr:hypothetical protein CRUP_024786 [Coryphaenoides rupestris]
MSPAYIQLCRGLMIASVCLGFLGAVLALVGMRCTRVGGSEATKARLAALAGFHFILCGLCCITACSVYAHRITTDFFDPLFVAQKAEYAYSGRASFASPAHHKPDVDARAFHGAGTQQRAQRDPPKKFERNAYV